MIKMNQEQNNLNPNNFNIRGNNDIPNNQSFQSNQDFNQQSLNLQPQSTTSYEQPIIEQSTPQPINNTFESSGINNFSLVNESIDNINTNVMPSNTDYNSQNNNNIEQKTLVDNYFKSTPPQIKNNKNIKMIIIITVVIVLLVGGLIFAIASFKDEKSFDYNDPSISDAIIVKNSDGLYGIINSNGKQLADFEYKSISDFLNGSAIITNSNNEVGIINSNGKMVVDFGKYKFIINEGYLYRVTDDDYNEFLLNAKGEIIYDLKDASVYSYIIPKEIVIVKLENSIDVLDYEGDSLIKSNGNSSYELYENEDNYTTFFHNNISYIIDIYKRKIVHKENSSTPYCVSSVNSEDKTKYVLTECEDSKQFIYMNNDEKLFSLNDCDNLYFHRGILRCAKDYRSYIVDDKGNKGAEISMSDADYIDVNNYIDKGDTRNTEFYVDGKLIKSVNCTSPYIVASKSEGIYILKNICSENNDTYSYYDKKGNKKIETNYKKADDFDENGFAIVSNDGINKYLIDINGKKISKKYDSIDYRKNIYVATKGSGTAVLNNKGSEILVTEGTVIHYDTYFTVSINGKTIYYNFDGKKIFENN